jgi:acetyltransferase-like isoleucine patch superfamily enzyme
VGCKTIVDRDVPPYAVVTGSPARIVKYLAANDTEDIGNHVTLWRTALSTEENGLIEIGDHSFLTNASLVCSEKIAIGERVFIAGGVTITDSDFHPLDPALRLADTIALSPIGNSKNRPLMKSKPVFIEDDVWIGFNATILKGVRIGAGAVIQPGALVTEDVHAGITVSGNPAKPVNLNQ